MKNKGFTLIELMVAMVVFSIVVAIVSGIFVQAIKSQKRILAEQELLDQTSYLVEYMSRAVRMAKKDTDGSCIGANSNYEKTHNGQGIKFENYQGDCQEFYLESGQAKEDKDGTISFLTSANLQVLSFNVGDNYWDQNDNNQPLTALFLDIRGKENSQIKIQTSIAQRNLDIKQ